MVIKIVKAVFGRYLLVTNTISCAALMGLGDVCIQKVEQRLQSPGTKDEENDLSSVQKKHDWARTGMPQLTHSLTHSLIHLITHSHTQSLTQSLTD